MLTFEKVLSVFKDYLSEDTRYEVLMTSRGYTVMEWDSRQRDWANAQIYPTPESLKNILLEALAGYLEYKTTLCERPLTDSERAMIQGQMEKMSALCR